VPTCTVPRLIDVRRYSAQAAWAGANFTTTVADQENAPNGNYKITYQSITGGTPVPCNASVLVNGQ
jgi:hypothetical protein